MPDVELVTDPADGRLGDYLALNEPATRRRVERAGGYFVVEGVLAIERLLTLPSWRIRSLLVLPKLADRLGETLAQARRERPDLPVLVADEAVLREVVGFDLHRGALAAVDRRPRPAPSPGLLARSRLLLVAEGVNDHENLGSLYRNAAAFGVDHIALDPTCADPFYRRSIRVSLGHVLAIPTLGLDPFPAGIEQLHDLGVTTLALSPSGEDVLSDIDRRRIGPGPVAVVVGAEGAGLTGAALDAAQRRVRIPMATGVDSVNVATAAAIALHHLTS